LRDLRKALDDIGIIRQQMATGTVFRGFGPAVMASTGLLALVTAAVQAAFVRGDDGKTSEPLQFFSVWVGLAAVSALLVFSEMRARTRRHHGGLADVMLANAVEHFLPAGAAGAAVALVLWRFSPDTAWILPGLWQVLVAIGLFAAQRFLPRAVVFAAFWYFATGITVMLLSSQTHMLSPWAMGLPFGAGQLLLAAVLHLAFRRNNDET